MEMDMQTAAGPIAEWFRHVRGNGPVLLGDLRRRHFEERDAIGSGQRILIIEVDLVLPIRILMIRLVHTPSQAIERAGQFLQVPHGRGHGTEVIARLRQ